MSVVQDIIRTYRQPREVQARRMSGVPREDRALAVLLAGCAVIYVAQWPRFAREAHLDPEIGLNALLAGGLFAWLMVMPLVFYALSLVLLLGLRVIGRGAPGYPVRMALFWAVLATGPIWLLSGLMAGFAPGAGFAVVSSGAFLAGIIFTAAGLSVASQAQGGAEH